VTPATLAIRLGGVPVRVRVEADEALLRTLRAFYPRARVDRRPLADVVVDARGVSAEGRMLLRGGERRERVAWTEWAVTCAAQRRMRGLRLHAAWVMKGRRSVLLLGRHGRGKTTLALALALRGGWRVLADDLVLLEAGGRVRPVGRPIRIKPGTARVLPGLRRLGGPLVPLKPGGKLPPVTALVVLGPRRPGPARRVDLTEGMAVARMAQLAANVREDPAKALGLLAALARRVRSASLRGGGLRERREAIESFVLG